MDPAKITIENLVIRFGERVVTDNLSLALSPGRITGLIGPNGAGKSTLLRVLTGLVRAESGLLKMGDTHLATLAAAERARKITYVGSELGTEFPLSTREFVALGGFSIERLGSNSNATARLREVMDDTGCWDYRDRALSELSGGERQRAHLARALLQSPDWICLDESFSKLDLHHQAKFGALLRRYVTQGSSFLFVSHDLNFTTDWADDCVLLREGKLVANGPTSEVVNEANIRRLYPSADIVLSSHPSTGAMKVYFRG